MKKKDFSNNKKFMIKGARFSSLCANIKYKDRLDLTLIFLEAGSIVTGVFTNSKTKAPSVIWSKKVVKSASKNEEEPIAIVINSGNANAFTGKEGTQTIEKVVSELGYQANKLEANPDSYADLPACCKIGGMDNI